MASRLTVCSCTGCAGCGERCPTLTPGGRCDECKRTADKARGSGSARGWSTRWSSFSKQYLKQHPACECDTTCCPDGCDQPATDVDHIDGSGRTGPRAYDITNLKPLAHSCHARKTATHDGGFGR